MYTPPSWAAEPSTKVVLEELLNGVSKGEHIISGKSTVSVGRNPDMCDVCLEDPFMSRKHAIFQHGAESRLCIWDLGSTHGTWVNNQRIPAGEFVELHSGAVIRFGPNPEHLFFLVGGPEPPEEDISEPISVSFPENREKPKIADEAPVNKEKAALEKYMKEQSSRSYKQIYEELLAKELTPKQRQERQNQPQYDRTAVTWGMVDDEIVYGDKTDQDIIRTDLLRALPNLAPRHLARIEDFEKKQKKMKAMIRDFNKIFELEEAGTKLNADQFHLKKEIEQRMNKLSGEMAVAEDKLKQMFGLDHHKIFKFSKDMRREEGEDDEFYDRTGRDQTNQPKVVAKEQPGNASALDPQKLREEARSLGYEKLMSNLKGINTEISSLKEWIIQQQDNLLRTPAEAEEELDLYIKEQRQEESKQKVARLRELQQESDRVVAMLRLVQPQFNKTDFDQEHERQEEERKIKQMFREEEKERRRRILEAMEKRNAELSSGLPQKPQTPQQTAEIWDSVEGDEEELAKLGKRVKAQPTNAANDTNTTETGKKEVKRYTVAAKPESRDEENEQTEGVEGDYDAMAAYEASRV